jgi:integrase/recombinase XerD
MAQAKTLTSAEIERLIAYISQRPNASRNRAMFLMTLLAGFRAGELADLTIGDVRGHDGRIKSEVFLAAHRVKHNHARTVFINQRLQSELEQYISTRKWHNDQQALFYTQKSVQRGFSANTLAQHFLSLYKEAGISGASSHSGRRTFITSLATQGVSVRVLASLAGHKSIATTQRYIDVNDDMKRRAVELV